MGSVNDRGIYEYDSTDGQLGPTYSNRLGASVTEALGVRANYGIGTSGEMASALSSFKNGAKWYNTTDSRVYTRVGGVWVADDSGWITASSFSNSFTAGTSEPSYRKIANRVSLTGELFRTTAPGTSELTAFTLPVGYRPLSTVAFTTLTFGSLTQPTMVVIATDGSVKVACATGRTGTPGFILSGISFLID